MFQCCESLQELCRRELIRSVGSRKLLQRLPLPRNVIEWLKEYDEPAAFDPNSSSDEVVFSNNNETITFTGQFNAEILNKGPLLTVYRTSQLVCLVCSFVNTTEPNVPDDSLNISGRYKSIISMLDGIDCNRLFSILINRLKSKINKNRQRRYNM